MQVSSLKAEPNPRGGQIDLTWSNPLAPGFKGVKIFRHEFTFPEFDLTNIGAATPLHDEIFPAGAGAGRFSDAGLQSETVYYYAVVAYDHSATHFPSVFISAMATGAYQSSAHLYQNLPALYQRHDTATPLANSPGLDSADERKGQLQRLVEMFGSQFDLLRSLAGGVRNFSEVGRIEGNLLPLLAEWIGWQNDFTLSLAKQRNEAKYAPHYYRTTGIAPNLRATINRLVTWDAQIKEFVHNVFRANNPEQLTLWEKERRGNVWQPAQPVTLEVAYEGKPAAVPAQDGRHWLFCHARRSVPAPAEAATTGTPSSPARVFIAGVPTQDQWHLWCKIYDQTGWLAARRVTFAGDINKYPAALQKNDGNFWLFWSAYEEIGGKRLPQIKLNLLSAGRPARPARARGTIAGPFAFADGDRFEITVDNGIPRVVTFRNEHFHNIAQASVAEVIVLLEHEIPGVAVTVTDDGKIILTSLHTGVASVITLPSSSVATKLGLGGPLTVTGSDAVAATLISGRTEPFGLNGYKLVIRVDQGVEKAIAFTTETTAAQASDTINRTFPGLARNDGGRIRLTSPTTGEASFLAVNPDPVLLFSMELRFHTELDTGSITEEVREEFERYGFTLVPGATIFVQAPGSEWIITNGARVYAVRNEESKLKIYDVANAAPKLGFGLPPPPATPRADDTEPAVFEDNGGNIWLFWSSRRTGTWKIWYNQFDAATHEWGRAKTLTSALFADRESAAVFDRDGEKIWVFWSRKKSDGRWDIFYRMTTNFDFNSHPNIAAESGDSTWTDVTSLSPTPANYDNKEPSAILLGANNVELYFSSNRTDGWNIWSKTLTPATPGSDAQITSGQFTQRAPAVLKIDNQTTRLWLRSNESQIYTSSLYPLAKTMDSRYSGSTTVDTRNPAKISRRRNLQDVQHYSYDTGKQDMNWYARDTVGIYLTPDTEDETFVVRKQAQIQNVLQRFLPIQIRAVFILQQVYNELVYTYDRPEVTPQKLIGEQMIDTILSEVYRGLEDSSQDRVNFRFLRSWQAEPSPGQLNDAAFRLFLNRVAEGE